MEYVRGDRQWKRGARIGPSLTAFFNKLWCEEVEGVVSAEPVRKAVLQASPGLTIGSQEDAHEFLLTLINVGMLLNGRLKGKEPSHVHLFGYIGCIIQCILYTEPYSEASFTKVLLINAIKNLVGCGDEGDGFWCEQGDGSKGTLLLCCLMHD